jgi:predicted nucleic acid-binding protein
MIIADTGFWLALANARDRHHGRARHVLSTLQEPLVTTWPVLTETCHLLVSKLGSTSSARFIESGSNGAFQIFALEHAHLVRVAELMHKYADPPMDLADASLVILAEELGSGRILSTDNRDFRTYRWKNRRPFKNLLLNAAFHHL